MRGCWRSGTMAGRDSRDSSEKMEITYEVREEKGRRIAVGTGSCVFRVGVGLVESLVPVDRLTPWPNNYNNGNQEKINFSLNHHGRLRGVENGAIVVNLRHGRKRKRKEERRETGPIRGRTDEVPVPRSGVPTATVSRTERAKEPEAQGALRERSDVSRAHTGAQQEQQQATKRQPTPQDKELYTPTQVANRRMSTMRLRRIRGRAGLASSRSRRENAPRHATVDDRRGEKRTGTVRSLMRKLPSFIGVGTGVET